MTKEDSNISRDSLSPSRKIGPSKNLFKLEQVNIDKPDSPLESEDYIAKETKRRRYNTIMKQKAQEDARLADQ